MSYRVQNRVAFIPHSSPNVRSDDKRRRREEKDLQRALSANGEPFRHSGWLTSWRSAAKPRTQ